MRNRIRAYLRSTFVRYMVSYVLLMLLLISCITVYMYAYYRKTMYQTTADSEINKLASVRYQNEGYVSTLTGIAEQLSLSSLATPFSFSESPQRAYELIQALKPYAATNDFCDQMYLVFHQDDYLYSSTTSVGFQRFIQTVMRYELLSPEELGGILRGKSGASVLPCQSVTNALLDSAAARMVTYIMPIGAGSAGNILFQVPESKFHLMLDDEIEDERNRYILYDDEIIVSSETFPLGAEYVAREASGISETRAYTKRVLGREYLLIAMPGNNERLTYFSAIPLTSIYRVAANGWISFVLMLLAFAAPCLLFVVWMSRVNYRPIREMRAQFGKDGDAYADDILTIRTGIRELASKNRDLDRQLEKSLPARRILFVQSLVKGRFPSRAEAENAARGLGLDVDKPYFAVLLLGAPSGGNGDVYLEKLLAGGPGDISCAGTDLLAYEQMLIVAFADESHRLREYAQALCARENVRAARIPVAISDAHDDISQMPTAYLEATSAYENRFVMGEARLLSFKDISLTARSVVPQSRNYVEAIKRAMGAGDVAEMNARLDELLLFLRNTDMSLFAFRQIYNDVIVAILSLREAAGAEGMDALKYYDLFTLSGCRSIDELDGILRGVCTGIMENRVGDGRVPLIRDILTDMTQNYTDSAFSLSAVAEKFSISTTRLTLEFKESMHMTPSDYLTMLRMEHAKKLLKQTDMSVQDICAQVGYADVSSFIRRFKQYGDLTPIKYRQSVRSAGEEV